MRAVRTEIVEVLGGPKYTKYKETDLFKLYQTTDLANIGTTDSELAARLPELMTLRASAAPPHTHARTHARTRAHTHAATSRYRACLPEYLRAGWAASWWSFSPVADLT